MAEKLAEMSPFRVSVKLTRLRETFPVLFTVMLKWTVSPALVMLLSAVLVTLRPGATTSIDTVSLALMSLGKPVML